MTDLPAGLTVSSGPLVATFLPELGMLGVSLRHRGEELLALPGGLDGYRAGDVTGLPLLAPWANRLGERRYEVEGVVVDLEGLALHTDDHGLPIHGTMSAQPGWEVVERAEHSFTTRFDFGAHPDLLASFPFPHELRIDVAVDRHDAAGGDDRRRRRPIERSRSRSATTPTSACPGASGRTSASASPPAGTSSSTTVGSRREWPAPRTPRTSALGSRTFDDLYELDDDRRLELTGGGRRLALELEEGYPFAQVFTPAAADSVCLEPMTAAGQRPRRRQLRARRVPEPRSPPPSPSTSRTPRTERRPRRGHAEHTIREPGVGIEPTTSALQEQCSTN